MPFEMPIRRGEDHPNAKLNNNERRACRRDYQQGSRVDDLARRHNVTPRTIRNILHQPSNWLPDEK